MIKKLFIKNFKSIKELNIDCRRINLFIGESNTSKSNILEALGLLSWIGHPPHKENLNNYLRFEGIEDLYFDNLLDEKMMIAFSNKKFHCLTTITF
jgi:AAA15 family ATPase/GTPase